MRRFFTLVLGTLAMVAVALISAFIAMRLAIHGREVEVPALTGLTVPQAEALAYREDLALTLENRFYSSSVPAGRVLEQYPAPGTRVRREWEMRITESLGPQRVSVPNLTGQSERAAAFTISRLSLDLGVVAQLSVPGDPDIVLAQTPLPNSSDADSPRVSLLVSDPAAVQPSAYVMPSLVGLSLSEARTRTAAAGLQLLSSSAGEYPTVPIPPPPQIAQPSTTPFAPPTLTPAQSRLLGLSPTPRPASSSPAATVVTAQSPPAGFRVAQGDTIRVTLGQSPIQATSSVPQ